MAVEGAVLQIQQKFIVIECYKCHTPFAVQSATRARWLENGEAFYCPNGHRQSYCKSKVDELEEKLASETRSREWYEKRLKSEREIHDATKNKLRGQKAANTKLKKRVGEGVCPCCNRTFKQLAQHMKNKHPEYADQDRSNSKTDGK